MMKALLLNLSALFFCASLVSAQISTPIQADEIININGSTSAADPGDTIRYQVTIQATSNATNVQLNVVPDPLTTFVPSTGFRTSPVAIDDGPYLCIGNIGINVPDGASDLLANDFDDNIGALTATAVTNAATTGGGQITILANGSFSYKPAPGFEGTDTYTYTVNDATPAGPGAPTTNTGIVNITVNDVIWFVDEDAGSNGDGRLNSPFNTLPNFFNTAADDTEDIIFLYHSTDNYTGGITLLNNQKLIGEGATASIAMIAGLTVPTFSNVLPTTGGSRPTVVNAGGDGVLLASGNTLQGFNIGNSSDFAIDDNGNVGTLTVSELDISTNGGGFQTDNGGTLAVTLGSVTSSGGSRGIYLNTTGGTFTVTGATSCTNPLNQGIRITSASTNVSFAAITIGNSGSGSEAMELNGNTGTFIASGLTTINAPAVGGGISLLISGGTGTITFADIDINGRRAKGISINGGSRNITTELVNIDNSNSIATSQALEINTPTGGTISFGATTIDVNGAIATAIDIQNSAATISFSTSSAVSNSALSEINIHQGNGNVTFNGTVTSTAGNAVSVSSKTGGTVSLTGNLSVTTTGNGILVSNNSGSIINFSGTNKSIAGTGGGSAIVLSSNTGSTINFTNGGLDVDATTASGIDAFGGGTINVTGANNTINTSSGTGLSIANTDAGTSGITFASILNSSGPVANINTSTGTKTLGRISTSSGASNALTLVTAGTVNVGDASNASTLTTAAGHCIFINATTLNLSGMGLDVTATTSGRGVNMTGGTVSITGGNLNIITNTGVGFNAVSGGTVSLTGSNNTINSTSATALNVTSTTIGASNLNFQSISAGNNTAAADPVNGIVLNTTGSSGGLTVTGTGAADSGGIIQNTTGAGISATNTQDLSLTRIKILNAGTHGIDCPNLRGTCLVANSTIQDWVLATGNGINLVNVNTNLTLLTVSATTFNGTATNNDGVFMEAQGTSSMALSVENGCLFTEMFGDGVQVNGITGATGTVNVTIKNSTFNNADPEDSPGVGGGNGGISLQVFGGINFTALVENNTLDDIMRPVTNLGAIGGTNGLTATANITIKNNTLNNIRGARGITFASDGSGLTTMLIDNNNIDRLGSTSKYAIQVNMIGTAGGVSSPGNITVTNNDIGQAANLWTSGNGNAEAIHFLTQNSSTMTTLVSGNVVTANANLEVIRARAIGTSSQNITYTNNTVTDNVGSHVGELAAITANTATLCMSATGNILPGGGVGVILLTEGTGTMNITQASSAALSAANSGATVTISGAPAFGQPACPTP